MQISKCINKQQASNQVKFTGLNWNEMIPNKTQIFSPFVKNKKDKKIKTKGIKRN